MDEKQHTSKTKAKRNAEEIQNLGVSLSKLSVDALRKLDLPEQLVEAICDVKKIKANGAKRRQFQYIGKIMRSMDTDLIQSKLDQIVTKDIKQTKNLHEVEAWRDKLIANDHDLEKFIEFYALSDIEYWKELVLATRKGLDCGDKSNYRQLFRAVLTIVEKGV